MKKSDLIFLLALLCSACSPSISPRTVLKEIKGIHLVEQPVVRNIIVDAHVVGKDKQYIFQNVTLHPVPVSNRSSNIIITDTIGYQPTNEGNTITPSEGGINVIIDANIQPGDYYCQTYVNGKMTCERGALGTHLNKGDLTTLATYSASNHFASAAYRNEIIIFQETAGGVVEAATYSTNGQTIYVYNENGNLVVAVKN